MDAGIGISVRFRVENTTPVGFIDYSLSLLTDTKSQNVLEVRTPYIYTKPTRGHYGAKGGCIWP